MRFYTRIIMVLCCVLAHEISSSQKGEAVAVQLSKDKVQRLHKKMVDTKLSLLQQLVLAEQDYAKSKQKLKEIEIAEHNRIFKALLDHRNKKKVPVDVIEALRDVKAAEKLIYKIRQKLTELDAKVIEKFGKDKCLDVSPRAKGPVKCMRIYVP